MLQETRKKTPGTSQHTFQIRLLELFWQDGFNIASRGPAKSESGGYVAIFWASGAALSSSELGKLGAQNPSASWGIAPGTAQYR